MNEIDEDEAVPEARRFVAPAGAEDDYRDLLAPLHDQIPLPVANDTQATLPDRRRPELPGDPLVPHTLPSGGVI